MTSTYELLELKRSEFKAFDSTIVRPLIRLNETEMDNLGFAEIAMRISYPDTRKRYCELAIAMLNANIAYHRPDATAISVPIYKLTAVVVSTLVVAGIAQHLSGTAAALFASAVWYWLAAETSRRRLEQLTKDAEAHNELVAEWVETLQEWEVVCGKLRSL